MAGIYCFNGKKKKSTRNFMVITSAALVLTSCVTPRVVQKRALSIDFTRFRTLSYTVHDAPDTEYGSNQEFGKETLTLFYAMLGSKLRSMGFDVVEANQAPELTIDVIVKAAKPGSAAARFWIGFGAGRAVLLYNARFVDATGNQIALLEGGRSHTGMEFGESFAGDEQIQAIAVSQSVRQIETFIRNSGSLP